MNHLKSALQKKSNWEVAEELERLIEVIPMVEAHRYLIKEAAERIKYIEY